jgi:CheY-like chemotaxis protein
MKTEGGWLYAEGKGESNGGSATSGRVGLQRKVLIIDDHPGMGMSLKMMLSPEHEVETAASPEAALELLESGAFDLVLCDVMMPGMNGLELYAKVKSTNEALAQKFVLMTGGATSAQMARALERSQLRVLEKPFEPELLRRMLAES